MDIKVHENSFDEIRQADKAGKIDRAVRAPVEIREARKEFRQAAEEWTDAQNEDAANYATGQMTKKAQHLEMAAGIKIKAGIGHLNEIRERRKQRLKEAEMRVWETEARGSVPGTMSPENTSKGFTNTEFPEDAPLRSGKSSGRVKAYENKTRIKRKNVNPGTASVKDIRLKGKNSKIFNTKKGSEKREFKPGKDIKTGEMKIRTSSDSGRFKGPGAAHAASGSVHKAFQAAAVFSYAESEKHKIKAASGMETLSGMLKNVLRALISSLAMAFLPVIAVLVIVVAVIMFANDAINDVGNQAEIFFGNQDDYEYRDDYAGRLEETGDAGIRLIVGEDSAIVAANDMYHEKVQELIELNSGDYDILNYENAEPDWKLITEVYIAMVYINNNGEFASEADTGQFEELMWNMVIIEYEFQSSETEPETAEDVTDETEQGTEPETELSVTLTIYARMRSVDEVAELYGIDTVELTEIVSLTDMYGDAIESAVSQLDRFGPEETESETEAETENNRQRDDE